MSGQIKDMQSIHIRPPEIEDRLIPGQWEGDLIKVEGNRSSVGTLVKRTTRFMVIGSRQRRLLVRARLTRLTSFGI